MSWGGGGSRWGRPAAGPWQRPPQGAGWGWPPPPPPQDPPPGWRSPPPAPSGYPFPYGRLPAQGAPWLAPRMHHHRFGGCFGSLLGLVVLVGLIGGAVGVPHVGRCTFCGPAQARNAASLDTYSNPARGYAFDHPAQWDQTSSDADGVEYSTDNGVYAVRAGAQQPDSAALDAEAAALPSSRFANLRVVNELSGAEIGFVPGRGRVYEATYLPAQGNGADVRIVLLAATQGNTTVRVRAISLWSSEVKYAPLGVVDGRAFDLALNTFRWPSR
ncbi:MAG: hypothetical protein NVS3B18_03690 [Candidatus Dormibacteria bacterium]